MKQKCPPIFLCAKTYRPIDDVGESRDTVFIFKNLLHTFSMYFFERTLTGTPYLFSQERYDRELVFETFGDFVKEKLGGATVVRLIIGISIALLV